MEKVFKEINRLKGSDLSSKANSIRLLESIQSPGKGVENLLRFWEMHNDKLNFSNDENGFKEFMLNNANSIRIDGLISVNRMSLIKSEKRLPTIFVIDSDSETCTIKFADVREDNLGDKVFGLSINNTGIMVEDEVQVLDKLDLTNLILMTYKDGNFGKIAITTSELEELKNGGSIVIPTRDVVGIYGIDENEQPTVQARFNCQIRIRRWRIEVTWSGDDPFEPSHTWSFP